METQASYNVVDRYPLVLRLLHWARAMLIAAQLWTGWTMVGLNDNLPAKFDWYYPTHKQFGILTLLLVLVQLVIRSRKRLRRRRQDLPLGKRNARR